MAHAVGHLVTTCAMSACSPRCVVVTRWVAMLVLLIPVLLRVGSMLYEPHLSYDSRTSHVMLRVGSHLSYDSKAEIMDRRVEPLALVKTTARVPMPPEALRATQQAHATKSTPKNLNKTDTWEIAVDKATTDKAAATPHAALGKTFVRSPHAWDVWWEGAPRRTDVTIVMADDRAEDNTLFRASIAQKRVYALRHGYGFSLSGGDTIIDPQRSEYPADLTTKEQREDAYRAGRTDAIAFGRLTAWDCWNKISALISASTSVPEGGWLWFVDSDVIITDMERNVDGLIHHAEQSGRSAMFTNWACGDGMNAGSVLVRNNEWGRSWFVFYLPLHFKRILLTI